MSRRISRSASTGVMIGVATDPMPTAPPTATTETKMAMVLACPMLRSVGLPAIAGLQRFNLITLQPASLHHRRLARQIRALRSCEPARRTRNHRHRPRLKSYARREQTRATRIVCLSTGTRSTAIGRRPSSLILCRRRPPPDYRDRGRQPARSGAPARRHRERTARLTEAMIAAHAHPQGHRAEATRTPSDNRYSNLGDVDRSRLLRENARALLPVPELRGSTSRPIGRAAPVRTCARLGRSRIGPRASDHVQTSRPATRRYREAKLACSYGAIDEATASLGLLEPLRHPPAHEAGMPVTSMRRQPARTRSSTSARSATNHDS